MIRGIHIGRNGYEVAKIDGSLESFYDICKCSLIDHVLVEVNGEWFDIICDDEGLFKPEDELFCRVYSFRQGPMLVGDVFVCKNSEAEFVSLSDNDVEILKKRIHKGVLFVD